MAQSTAPKSAYYTDLTKAFGLGTGPVSTRPYYPPEYFELEREPMFKRAWLALGRVEQVPEPGSFVTKKIHRGARFG